jgi:hypothetical protein
MTTYYQFTPIVTGPSSQIPSVLLGLNPLGLNPVATTQGPPPFNFQPNFDGNQYNISVPWCLFGQRYYVQCETLSGSIIFYLPLVSSGSAIYISNVNWLSNTVTITTSTNHGFKVGSIVNITIKNTIPLSYNGTYKCTIINNNQFTYYLQSYPGTLITSGIASYDVSMTAGYFNSTLIYRAKNMQFEVSP